MAYYIGSDIGGTFTDCVVMDDSGRLVVAKAPSTPEDFSQGLMEALSLAASRLGVTLEEMLAATNFFPHGCTVATNALITRSGARVGLITTKGFEETLFIMRGSAYCQGLSVERWYQKSRNQRPFDIVPLSRIAGVTERMDKGGREVVPLNREELLQAAKRLVEEEKVEVLAIGFLWSFMNPAHEEQARNLVSERYPGLYVDTSSEVCPLLGEYERFSTVAVNGYLRPAVERYVLSLKRKLASDGLKKPLYLMQASGGLLEAERAATHAVSCLHSGPTGGLVAARIVGGLIGSKRLLTGDMGGTSFDISILVDGQMRYTRRSCHERHVVGLPMADISSIGAGGGSIAYVEDGLLKVGPRSAGMVPGPACYGRGGVEPTVTDANLVLGYLNPDYFLAGRVKLDKARAQQAIYENVARPLGMEVAQAAAGIVRIVNAHMADAIRFFVLQRGYDPREFDLIIFGGAGPAHALEIARELELRSVVVPLRGLATVLSAFGIANSDLMRLYQSSHSFRFPPEDFAELNAVYDRMEKLALREMAEDGFGAGEVEIRRSASMRYHLQLTDVDIEIPSGRLDKGASAEIVARFDSRYAELYGENAGFKEAGRDLVSQLVRAIARTPKGRLERGARASSSPEAAAKGCREAYFDGACASATVYDGDRLEVGHRIAGPAILETEGTTVVVSPGSAAEIDPYTNILLEWQQ